MNTYTVKQLAELTGITVRTLHHYDEIGLLKPSSRSDADYRLYDHQDLLRLQQILLYKEMDFALAEIKTMLDEADYDLVEALKDQKRFLLQKQDRYQQLISTVDKTIKQLEEDAQLVTDAELYEGFSTEQIERYNREVIEAYGQEKVDEVNQRIKAMSKGKWKEVKAEGDNVSRELAPYVGKDPKSPEVQALIKRHHAWIENFYPAPANVYLGLAQMYVENPEFKAHYDEFAPGLAEFLKAAMEHYADTALG